jgi:hypothetical protein
MAQPYCTITVSDVPLGIGVSGGDEIVVFIF